jgi:uncharacterized membrane protein YoaK (UPF0700 family)
MLLYTLTLVAGYADAVAYFGLGVFTANMTGNTVLLGGALIGRVLSPLPGDIGLLLPLLSLAGFVCGAVAAAAFLRRESGSPPHRTVAVLLCVAVLMAVVAGTLTAQWPARGAVAVPSAVAVLSAVMGLQSIVAVRAGVEGVSTTFVTGTLVRSVVDLVGRPATTPDVRAEGATNVRVWGCYLLGAAFGALALRALGGQALWIPAAVVCLLPGMV